MSIQSEKIFMQYPVVHAARHANGREEIAKREATIDLNLMRPK